MASMQKMNTLLGWATNYQQDPNDPDYVPPRPMQDIDPGLIDKILGKPDAVRMREAMSIATDESKSEDDRVRALDDLELLVESLDNANDMETLKIWDPLLSLTRSSSPAISAQALWVVGTAIQNNPQSQAAFLSHNPLPNLIASLSPKYPDEVRGKVMYCLSGGLKHNRIAVEKFGGAMGWNALRSSLSDPSKSVRRKVPFLFNSLLLTDSSLPSSSPMATSDLTRAAMTSNRIIPTLTLSILTPTPYSDGDMYDADFEEKTMRTLVTYLQDEKAEDVEKRVRNDVADLLKQRNTDRGVGWSLDAADWDTLKRVAS